MSMSFRPVNEVWGEPSSCFVEPSLLMRVLFAAASHVGTKSEAYEYGDKTAVWIGDGRKLLDLIGSKRRFSAGRVVRWLGLHHDRHRSDLRSLVSNMRALATAWQNSVDSNGALTFYVDAY